MVTVLLSLALALGALGAAAAPPEIPPSPTRWVTDNAGLISPATRENLDRQLEAFERSSGHQVLVYIERTTGGRPIEEFAVRAFEKWRVGRKGLDDGLVLFIFTEDRHLRIEVGYGLEGTMPDILAGRIVRDEIAPRLAAGQPDAAVTAGVAAIVSTLGGSTAGLGAEAPTEAPRYARGPQPQELGWGGKIVLGILGLIFLFILITHPRLALWILFNLLMSGRGGGGGFGGGGGGFSGGGGRSGGGGASGSW